MKKFLLSIIMVLPVLFMGSCEKESEGLTRITYYPLLSVNGSSAVIGIGESFVDEGCTATLNGKDVSSEVQSSNNIDNTKYGAYKVNYIVYNEDGFSASASRDVFVTNGTNFANLYLADSKYGSRQFSGLPISIYDNGDGTYTIEDILGGFYGLGRYPQYIGSAYNFFAESVIALNPDNSISLVEVGDWYFGVYPITIKTGTYDPATCKITLALDFDGDPFSVSLVVPTK
jgi:hypothetical protein